MSDDLYQKKFRVPSARYIAHDYNHGMYFITVCTAAHVHYFGKITNGEMELNALGEYLLQNLQNVSLHYPYAEIPLFVIMPNHIHAIVIIDDTRRDVACRVSSIDVACRVSKHRVSDGHNGFETPRDAARHISTEKPTIINFEKNPKMQSFAKQCGLLSTTIGGLKSAITKFANTNKITFGWQTRFYDRIIRDQDECNQIAKYIEENPAKWEIDKHKI